MRAALAEMRRTETLPDATDFECDQEVADSSDRVSTRGLEILRILNDVFNGLHAEAAVGANDRLTNHV
jgi:hypothetical protein